MLRLMGVSAPSLHRESTDSPIQSTIILRDSVPCQSETRSSSAQSSFPPIHHQYFAVSAPTKIPTTHVHIEYQHYTAHHVHLVLV